MHGRRWTLVVAVAVAVAVLVTAGCTERGAHETGERRSASPPAVPQEQPPDRAGPEPDAQHEPPPAPAATAGALDRADVPSAAQLGDGWHGHADPGGPEKGFRGNGEFVRSRDPGGAAQSVVPLGCPGVGAVPALPTPRHALEATYRHEDGSPGVALVLEYRHRSRAREAFDRWYSMVQTCTPPADGVPADRLRPVIEIQHADSVEIRDVRRYAGPGAPATVWHEVVVLSGRRVGLLTIARPPGAPTSGLDQLADTLRRRITTR